MAITVLSVHRPPVGVEMNYAPVTVALRGIDAVDDVHGLRMPEGGIELRPPAAIE